MQKPLNMFLHRYSLEAYVENNGDRGAPIIQRDI